MTVEEYQLALCLAGTTIRSSDGEERFVPLLEGVREKCPCLAITHDDGINHWYDQGGCKSCWIAGRGPGKHELDCASCQGRGWIPTTKPWPYLAEAQRILPPNSGVIRNIMWATLEGELSVYQVLAKALGVG